MSCGEVLCKSVSGIFSFIFMLASLAVMAFAAFAAYVIILTTSTETMARYFVAVPAIVTFALAVILIIALIIACCAMCQNSICCLDTYSILLIILALGNIGIGTYSLITFKMDYTELRVAVTTDVLNAMMEYPRYPKDINNMQELGRCCGIHGPSSYHPEPGNYRQLIIPKSCCSGDHPTCTEDSPDVFRDGCGDSIFSNIIVFNYILGWAAIIIGISEIVATVAAFYLSCMFWRGRSYNDW